MWWRFKFISFMQIYSIKIFNNSFTFSLVTLMKWIETHIKGEYNIFDLCPRDEVENWFGTNLITSVKATLIDRNHSALVLHQRDSMWSCSITWSYRGTPVWGIYWLHRWYVRCIEGISHRLVPLEAVVSYHLSGKVIWIMQRVVIDVM